MIEKSTSSALETQLKIKRNILKKMKKELDKEHWVVYTNEAVAESEALQDSGTLKTS